MQLRSKAEVETAISKAYGVTGFSAPAGVSCTDKVMACCNGASAETNAAVAQFVSGGDVGAVPFMLILQLAMQIIPILFGEGGFTIEKLQAVMQLILGIFQ